MSNRFSNGRLRLPRPKVCKSDPPPITVGEATCNLVPIDASGFAFFDLDISAQAQNLDLPLTDVITLSVLTGGGFSWFNGQCLNDDILQANILMNSNGMGFYELTTRFTWPNGSTCDLEHTVTLI